MFLWHSDNGLDLSEQAVTSGAIINNVVWIWGAAWLHGKVIVCQAEEAALNYQGQRALACVLSERANSWQESNTGSWEKYA